MLHCVWFARTENEPVPSLGWYPRSPLHPAAHNRRRDINRRSHPHAANNCRLGRLNRRAVFHRTCNVWKSASKAHLPVFFVRQRLFELPILPEGGLALLDEDQKSLFMTWLGEHGSSVMKVARAYTLTNEECQDLTQEILLQAWRSLPKFEGKANVATWFYRVALLTAMNWHRKDRPRRSKQQPLLEVQAVVADGLDSGEQAQQRETVEQVYDAIHQLPKTDAALVLPPISGVRMPCSSSQAAGRLPPPAARRLGCSGSLRYGSRAVHRFHERAQKLFGEFSLATRNLGNPGSRFQFPGGQIPFAH